MKTLCHDCPHSHNVSRLGDTFKLTVEGELLPNFPSKDGSIHACHNDLKIPCAGHVRDLKNRCKDSYEQQPIVLIKPHKEFSDAND